MDISHRPFAAKSIALLLAAASIGHLASSAAAQSRPAQSQPQQDWPVYGGHASADHYSTLDQIDRANVNRLRLAWTYDTGEAGGQLQTNPLVVGRVLYGYTPSQKVIALDAATGKLLWKFDSGVPGTQPSRGLAYWTNSRQGLLLAGVMNFLYALDPATGKPIPSFGEGGRIDLRKGLGADYLKQSIALTSPPVVYKDLVIVGGRNPETQPAPPGDIRAFDVHTGALRWRFRTIPHPGQPGYETWPKDAWKSAGAANCWAGMSLDQRRGIVFVPTGSAVPDFFGGDRIGNDLFADTLLALDAATGKMLWHFQGVHHDIWDRDFPAAPVLMTIQHDGKPVDVVVQSTKQGLLFVLDRITGKPIFPIEERPVAASTVPGEVSSRTQPFPVLPKPYTMQAVTENDLTARTPEAHAFALAQFRKMRSGGQFTPLSLGVQTLVAPGFDGGGEWGGPGADPRTGILYINANNIAYTGGLEVNDTPVDTGAGIYQTECAVCHGSDREGSPPAFPSLQNIGQRLNPSQIADVVHQGKGRMPAFPDLQDERLNALLEYLRTGKTGIPAVAKEMAPATPSEPATQPTRYNFTGYKKFYDQEGYPATKTPWGTLSAIDLNKGKYLWQVPLGEYPELAKQAETTGSENYGGPVVTAGGLVFIGATVFDRKFRAYDARSGQLLWQTTLPLAGLATPSTYMVDGKQYVVIAAGGGKDPKMPAGGYYIAFALP